MTTKALIIPAAGSGSRLQKETPKPYLEIGRNSILEYSIRRFLHLDGLAEIIIATSADYLDQADRIITNCVPDTIAARCVEGGAERQDSIYNALQDVSDVDLVLIHDAVRPFVMPEHVSECCSVAEKVGGAVLGVPAKDTIKRVDDHDYITETPSRKYLWQAQTPQAFRKDVIMKAHKEAAKKNYRGTDDSSLVEWAGMDVKMVEGDRSNFKITYPLDLKLAELLIDKQQG